MKKMVDEINRSFAIVTKNEGMLKAFIGGVQGQLDKFKNEIGSNGVFSRLNKLEVNVFGSDTNARLQALEDYLKIVPVVNKEERTVVVPGLHYEKKTKSKKTSMDFDLPF